jgi:hypothetical protein
MKCVLLPGECDQQSLYLSPDVPSVISPVATAYSWKVPDAVTEVVDDKPVNVLTPSTSLPHDSADSKMRITFDVARPAPESCSEHVSVSVQSVACVKAPFIVNAPTLNK